MASIVKTVMTGGGGDYTSLSAALAALAQDLTLITPDVADDDGNVTIAMKIVCSGVAADTTLVNFNGAWTSDPTHRLLICGASVIGPKWDATKYRLSTANAFNGTFQLQKAINLDFDDFQIENTATLDQGPKYFRFEAFAYDVRIHRGFARLTGTTGTPSGVLGFYTNPSPAITSIKARNFTSVCAGAVTLNVAFNSPGGGTVVLCYNNTLVNLSTGDVLDFGKATGDTFRFQNLLLQGSGANYGAGNQAATQKTDILTQDATGSASLTAKTCAFVDPANWDFHLAAADPAIGHGADLHADANMPFSTDGDNAARTAPWDIGADQYSAGGGGGGATDTRPDLMHDTGFQVQLATM